MPDIDRRHLIVGGAGLGVGVLLLVQPLLRPVEVHSHLLRWIGGSAGLRSPQNTGMPDDAMQATLWLLFTRIVDRWQLGEWADLAEPVFAEIIRAKTTQTPSYLTEYRSAVEILDEMEDELRKQPAAFDQLFALPVVPYDFNNTPLGRLQQFVIGEFIELQIAYGGFRAFGYRNYRGYAGGALANLAVPTGRSG